MEPKAQEPIKLINVMIRVKNAFFQWWPLVLILALLNGGRATINAKKAYVPMYESKAIFTVESGYKAEDIFGTGAFYDQYAAQQLAEAFPQILSTDMMFDLVLEQIEGGYINGTASAYSVVDSNMLVLTARSTVPQDAKNYLEAIIECYPQVAVYMVDNPQVKIMQNPTLPTDPCNSFSAKGLAIRGGIIGVILGMAFIFAVGLMTRTIQTTDELKNNINLPILVALPKVTQKKRRNTKINLITAEMDSNLSECLRGLRLKVKRILDDPSKKTILVTSTLASEGKTTIALNLALSLTKEGHKVLVLDADVRNQSVAKALGMSADGIGMLELMGDAKLSLDSAIRTDKSGKLDFISGCSTEKRHYTLEKERITGLLNRLKERYDYVVIDTPPCEVVSDASVLCRYADSVLYVVKQDYAKRGQVINAVTSLHQKDVRIDGCIFNGVPQFHRQYDYGYRSSYGYGYDYGYRKYSYGKKYGYGYSKYSQPDTEEI